METLRSNRVPGTYLETFFKQTPYNRVMAVWASWITLKDRNEPGGWSNPQDAKEFMRTGEVVEAMINGLPRHQWWAIRKSRGICTVWIFPTLNILDALEAAEITLTTKMKKNADTHRFFN